MCDCILQTKVQASDIHGLFHGVNTFMQLMVLCQEGGIPHLQVNDNNTDMLANIMLESFKIFPFTEISIRMYEKEIVITYQLSNCFILLDS